MSTAMNVDKAITRGGHTIQQLRIDIAQAQRDDKWLAGVYGITAQNLRQFKLSEADAIAAIRRDIDAGRPIGTTGVWSADKSLRIADTNADIDDMNSIINRWRDADGLVNRGFGTTKEYLALVRTKEELKRSIADQQDGPRRSRDLADEDRMHVRYQIGGEDNLLEGLT